MEYFADRQHLADRGRPITGDTISPNAHSTDEMHAILAERIRRVEAGEEEVVPNQVVFDSIRSKYGF